MSSITNSYSSLLYSSYYQNPTNTNKTTSETYKQSINQNDTNSVNPMNQDSKTTLLSDKEILSEINNQAQFYQQAWKNIGYTTDNLFAIETSSGRSIFRGGTTTDKWDMHFIDTIENKLKSNKGSNITQQDAENAQKFLFEQMDSVMLTLYKENPELMQETMEKCNQFYASNQLTGDASYYLSDYYQSLEINKEKISALLLDYGARTESQKLEEGFLDYLGSVSGILKNLLSGGEIETKEIEGIQDAVYKYRANKMKATGYGFFAAVTDKLSPALQEQITDAIAQVMSFYSQPHSMEINGYKISWESQYDAAALGTLFSAYGGVLTSVSCTDIQISFSDFNPTLSQDTFLALSSTFDSSQSFFEVLEQRDRLEKENQELKTKQAYNAYGISQNASIQTDSPSDSILQTLLKESKEGEA